MQLHALKPAPTASPACAPIAIHVHVPACVYMHCNARPCLLNEFRWVTGSFWFNVGVVFEALSYSVSCVSTRWHACPFAGVSVHEAPCTSMYYNSRPCASLRTHSPPHVF